MKYYGLSDIGSFREKNQDSYTIITNNNGDLLSVVADGVGGSNAGEVASLKTCEFLKEEFLKAGEFKDTESLKNYLKDLIERCNYYISKEALKDFSYYGMGTTLTGIVVSSCGKVVFNVGDSRCYGIKEDTIDLLTYDDTLVNEMIRMKEITEEEALTHPKRHFLMKAIGMNSLVNPQVEEISEYDYYLCCSDGLHGYLEEDKIKEIIMNKESDLETKCSNMLSLTLLKGGYDNITIVLLKND